MMRKQFKITSYHLQLLKTTELPRKYDNIGIKNPTISAMKNINGSIMLNGMIIKQRKLQSIFLPQEKKVEDQTIT